MKEKKHTKGRRAASAEQRGKGEEWRVTQKATKVAIRPTMGHKERKCNSRIHEETVNNNLLDGTECSPSSAAHSHGIGWPWMV